MNKNIVWSVIVAVLLIVIVVLASGKSINPPSNTPEAKPETTVSEKQPVTGKTPSVSGSTKSVTSATGVNPAPSDVVNTVPKTFRQLVASNLPLKCTFTDSSGSTSVEGTVYISGTKARADLTVTYSNTTFTHEVIMGEKTYIWANGSMDGAESTLASGANPTATVSKNGINADKKITYRCDKWIADMSKFELPPAVVFKAQ